MARAAPSWGPGWGRGLARLRATLLAAAVSAAPGCAYYDVREGCDPRYDSDRDGIDDCADCDPLDRRVSIPDARVDADGDGHGAIDGAPVCPGSGTAPLADDCDDAEPAVFEPSGWVDADGDGAGGATPGCAGGEGVAPARDDCDDADAGLNPAAAETWDGRDEDCDGVVDDLRALDALGTLWVGAADARIGGGAAFTAIPPRVAGEPDRVAVFQPGDALAASWARFAPAWGDPRAVAPITDPSLPSLRREGCARLDWFRQECTGYAGAWVRAVPDTPDLDGDGVAELTLLTLAPNPWNDLLGLHQPSGRVDLYDAAALGPQTSGAATRATVASPPEPVFPNGFQQGPREAAWADVDGDGARELVVAAPGDGFFAPFGAASQNGRLSVYPAGALGGGDVPASAAVADVWGESGWGLGGGLVQARLDDGPSEDLVTRLARGPWGSVGLVLGEELARGDVSPGGLRLWGTILGEAWAPLRDARVLAAALTPDAYDDLVVVVGEPGLRAAYIFLRTDGRAWGERSIADADRVIRPDAAWFGDPLASELGAGACAVDGWLFLGDPAAPGLDGQARAGAVFGWAAGTGGLSGEPSLRIQHDTAGDRLGAWLTCGGAGAAAWVAVGVEAWRDPESPLTAVGAMGVLRARGPDG